MTRGAALRAYLGQLLALALAYFLFGLLARLLVPDAGYVTPVWPAAGVALAALVHRGLRLWPGIVLGVVLVEVAKALQSGTPEISGAMLALAAGVGAGSAGQAMLGAWLARRYAGLDEGLLRGADVVRFLALAGPVSCLAGAAWSHGVLALAGHAPPAPLSGAALWWVGDSVGVLAVAPLLLSALGTGPVWRQRRLTVAVPVLVCLLCALGLHGYARAREHDRLHLEFEARAEALADAFAHILDHHATVVRSVASLLASVPEVSRAEFRDFVARPLETVPGIQALSWNPHVGREARAQLEARARAEGLTGYRIWERAPDGSPVPAPDRDAHVAVYYLEPMAGNEPALGFDIASEPTRAAALEAALAADDLRVTERITLVQESGSQAGVLAVVPVSDRAADAERRLRGYAVGVFRLGDVLESAFAALPAQAVTAWLEDASAPAGQRALATYHLDRRHRHHGIEHADEPVERTAFEAHRGFDFGGRRWSLRLGAQPRFMAHAGSLAPALVLGGGLLLASLTGGFLLALTGRAMLDARRARALALEVAERERAERALSEEKERVEVTLHCIGDAVLTTDASGRVEYMNPVAEAMTGWKLDEARDRALADVFQIVAEATDEPAPDPVQRCLQEGRIIGLANHTVLVSRSGRRFSIQDSAAPIRDAAGRILGVVLVFNDVTEARRMAREAEHYASHDPLTELVNRREFERRLDHALASARNYGARHALCYLDLDQFKVVNDTAGHRAGDALLKDLAALLSGEIRDRDTLARLGGDEFGVLLDNCPLDKAHEIASNLVRAVRDHRFAWENRSFQVGASIGVVPITGQTRTSEELLTQADVACYAAKDAGRSRVYLYDAGGDGTHPRHVEILRAADLRSAVEQDRFRLHVQPILPLGDTAGAASPRYEVLLRLTDETGELVMPAAFIPAAERYGLMDGIDRWVVRRALARLQALRRRTPGLSFALNLSGNSLNDDGLFEFLAAQLAEHEVPPGAVCFEITETAAIHNLQQTVRLMGALQALGCRFALDDFGSGLSSFSYLKHLPVDYLKIDGSFVRDLATDDNDRAMVGAINQVAHTMGIQTIAEYARDDACVVVLRTLGVDFAQGYALGRPRPIDTLDEG